MTQTLVKPLVAILILLISAGHALAAKDDLPAVTEDGLHRVEDSKMAIVYADPQADLSIYDSVMLLEAYVAFRKNWARDQRSTASSLSTTVKPRDMEKMKNTMAKEFDQVFREVLAEGGYTLSDTAGESVLLVRPAIIDLNPTAPDISTSTASRTYVRSAGDMSLYIELYDSLTGDLIAKALDRRGDSSMAGYYSWANPASNAAASRRILKGWAGILRDALDEARQ
jgi:hypothetical protein